MARVGFLMVVQVLTRCDKYIPGTWASDADGSSPAKPFFHRFESIGHLAIVLAQVHRASIRISEQNNNLNDRPNQPL